MDLFTAREYLKIDIANSFGLDKLDWKDRIFWFDANEHRLLSLMAQAEDPALYFAGITAWADVLAGKPIGYTVSLDATSSGLQLLAVLTGDRKAAEICNVVDVGKRMDAYTAVYDYMLTKMGGISKIKRDDTKKAIMTALYGSTAMPKQVFGEGEQLAIFIQSMNDLAPAVWELNEAFLSMWDPTVSLHEWILPDNFHVKVKVMSAISEPVQFLNEPFEIISTVNMPTESGRSLGANTTHSLDGMIVREMTRRCSYDPEKIKEIHGWLLGSYVGGRDAVSMDDKMVVKLWDHYQKSGYLSARIFDHLTINNWGLVNHLDIRELIDSLPPKPFTVLSVHQWCT